MLASSVTTEEADQTVWAVIFPSHLRSEAFV